MIKIYGLMEMCYIFNKFEAFDKIKSIKIRMETNFDEYKFDQY